MIQCAFHYEPRKQHQEYKNGRIKSELADPIGDVL